MLPELSVPKAPEFSNFKWKPLLPQVTPDGGLNFQIPEVEYVEPNYVGSTIALSTKAICEIYPSKYVPLFPSSPIWTSAPDLFNLMSIFWEG